MKLKIFILLFLLLSGIGNIIAQENEDENNLPQEENNSATKEIKHEVAERFNKWLQKGMFEKISEYKQRIKDADSRLQKITEEVLADSKSYYIEKMQRNLYLSDYNADIETYLLKCVHEDTVFQDVKIRVPAKIAKALKEKIDKSERHDEAITFFPRDCAIINDKWVVTDALIFFRLADVTHPYLTVHIEKGNVFCKVDNYYRDNNIIIRPKNLKQYTDNMSFPDCNPNVPYPKNIYTLFYDWVITEQPKFNPASIQPITLSLEDLNITLPTSNRQ